MNQNPEMQSFAYQDDRSSYTQELRNQGNAPAFLNQRSKQANQEMSMNQAREMRRDAQPMALNNAQANQQTPYIQANQMNQRRNSMDDDIMEKEVYQAYPSENTSQINRSSVQRQLRNEDTMAEEMTPRKMKGRKQKKKQDPFDFQEEPQERKQKRTQKRTAIDTTEKPYTTYVHQNVIVFFISLLDAALVSITTASIVYTNFFKRYTSVNSEIVIDIIIKSLIVTVIAAYITAAVHTGYTILKKSLQNWKTPVKVILSPLLLVISLLIGVICEIPYLIVASIKKGREKN